MADPMDTLKSILGDNAEETIQSVMNALSGSGESSGGTGSSVGGGPSVGGGSSVGGGPSVGGNSGGADLGALLGSLGGNSGNGGPSVGGGNGGGSNGGNRSPLANIDPESMAYLMQMRDIVSKMTDSRSDSRSNLLMSLKPYMRDTRKRSIESAVRLLNISKLAGLFRL